MCTVVLDVEVRLLEERSEYLMAHGATVGAQDQEHVARYLAASERVERMSDDEVVDVLRQAVENELPVTETDALRRAARTVLLSLVL